MWKAYKDGWHGGKLLMNPSNTKFRQSNTMCSLMEGMGCSVSQSSHLFTENKEDHWNNKSRIECQSLLKLGYRTMEVHFISLSISMCICKFYNKEGIHFLKLCIFIWAEYWWINNFLGALFKLRLFENRKIVIPNFSFPSIISWRIYMWKYILFTIEWK